MGARKPYLDAEGCIHWPVLLMYPETMQQDVVEDWHEGDTLADHLDVVRAVGLGLGKGGGGVRGVQVGKQLGSGLQLRWGLPLARADVCRCKIL